MDKFKDKVFLVTGGTGSFGSTMVRRVLREPIREVRVFSRDEAKQDELRRQLADERVKFFLGDIRDFNSLMRSTNEVDFIFHAAALKQVPSCEFHPMEAVKTNIIGTENVLNAATNSGVDRVVVLSTDKAVYPINAMGISKALMEKLVISHARLQTSRGTTFCGTRYGNVLASRGSIIPLFISQIKQGKPITITNPAMTRFLMTLPESVDLVMHAFSSGQQGDIFVQKSKSASIIDIANALLRIFKSKVGTRIIGTRHGEKLFEVLVSREEMARADSVDKYFRIPMDSRDLDYEAYFERGDEKIVVSDDYTSINAAPIGQCELERLLLSLDYVRENLHA